MTKTFILPIGGGGGIDPSEKLAKNLSLTMDEDYVISASLIDQDGNVLGDVQTVDLPLESVVVDGRYDENTKSIILTLDNGNEITIPVGALVSGLVSTEQLQGLQAVVDTKADSADLTALQGVVGTLQGVVDTKADSSDLTALQGVVNNLQGVVDTKADSSDLTALQGVVNNLQGVVDTKADSSDLTALQGVVATKQDQLTAGENITIVDNVISAQGGGGGNAWYGTQAQFDSLGTYDEDTDYFISDKIDYSEIKHAPNPNDYYKKTEVDAKDTVLNSKIAAKMEATFMTEAEFAQITPLEGANYFIEGTTRALTFTFADQTTETINFVAE